MTEPTVTVVRAVVDAPDRASIDYLGADGKWTCAAHPKASDCAHLDALREHVTRALLKAKAATR